MKFSFDIKVVKWQAENQGKASTVSLLKELMGR